MKFTLGQLVASKPALEKLLNNDLPVAVSFRLSKLIKSLNSELQHHEEERIKLVKKYGTTNETGVAVLPDRFQEFVKDMDSLNGLEVNLDIKPVSIEDLD